MNRLLKNTPNQIVPFLAINTGGSPILGLVGTMVGLTGKDTFGQNVVTGPITEEGNGVYFYHPTQDESNGDIVYFSFNAGVSSMVAVLEAFRTESPSGDAVLAAVQPHYAPAKAGDLMGISPNQDIRNILGSVAGDLHGNILGSVPSPVTLTPGAVDSILDRTNGAGPGTTPRQAFTQLVAALVNVQVAFALSSHVGPTSSKLKPRFPNNVRTKLATSVASLLQVIELANAAPELGILAPNLATACQQLATALDAVRTSTA